MMCRLPQVAALTTQQQIKMGSHLVGNGISMEISMNISQNQKKSKTTRKPIMIMLSRELNVDYGI